MNIDPRRDFIWQELHARPYVRFDAPAHVFHFAFFCEEGLGAADHTALDRVITTMGLNELGTELRFSGCFTNGVTH